MRCSYSRLHGAVDALPEACIQRFWRRLANDVKGAALAKDIELRLPVRVARESQRDARRPDAEILEEELRQPVREHGIDDQRLVGREWNDTGERLHDERKGGRVPELRSVGLGV